MNRKYTDLINTLLTCLSCKYELHNNQITKRSLFGGIGLCFNGLMFGWILNDELYLKGHPQYLATFKKLNMSPLVLEIGVTLKLLQYYKVTNSLWKNKQQLIDIILVIIDFLYQDKKNQSHVQESRIKDLPNMTLSLERALFRVGVIDTESFRKIGTFNSYFRLKQQNQNISKNILFILYSALMGLHVATLSNEQKVSLKNEYKIFVLSRKQSLIVSAENSCKSCIARHRRAYQQSLSHCNKFFGCGWMNCNSFIKVFFRCTHF